MRRRWRHARDCALNAALSNVDLSSLVRLVRSNERFRVDRVRRVRLSRTTEGVAGSSPRVAQMHTRATRDATPCSQNANGANTSVRRSLPNVTACRHQGTEGSRNDIGGLTIGVGCKPNGTNCPTPGIDCREHGIDGSWNVIAALRRATRWRSTGIAAAARAITSEVLVSCTPTHATAAGRHAYSSPDERCRERDGWHREAA